MNPSVDGVGVSEPSLVAEAGTDNEGADAVGTDAVEWTGFLAILDLVCRTGNGGAIAVTTGFGGGTCRSLDRVTRCGSGGVSTISLSSSSSSASPGVAAGSADLATLL